MLPENTAQKLIQPKQMSNWNSGIEKQDYKQNERRILVNKTLLLDNIGIHILHKYHWVLLCARRCSPPAHIVEGSTESISMHDLFRI